MALYVYKQAKSSMFLLNIYMFFDNKIDIFYSLTKNLG